MTAYLTLDMGGRWAVQTKTSLYLLDLDNCAAIRQPGQPAADEYRTAALRKDGEQWQIARLITCEIGLGIELMAFGIADDPDVMTYRNTTPVVAITPLEDK